jgi:hypothetical protein
MFVLLNKTAKPIFIGFVILYARNEHRLLQQANLLGEIEDHDVG